MLYKRKDSGFWWVKFKFKGRTYAKSTRVTNKREAQQIESAWKTNVARAVVDLPSHQAAPLLGDYITRFFIPYVKKLGKSPKTTTHYIHHATILAESRLGDVPLDTISPGLIDAFCQSRRKQEYAPASINRDLGTLRRILLYAKKMNVISKAPTVEINMKVEGRRDRVVSPTEEARYLAAAEPLLHDAMTVLFDTGLRPEELFRLQQSEYREGCIVILEGKGSASRRTIPATKRVREILDARAGNDSQWLFPHGTKSGHIEPSSIRKMHQRALKKSGVTSFLIYSARHTCITRWSKKFDAFTLKALAGHEALATTQRYVHGVDLDAVRAIIDEEPGKK